MERKTRALAETLRALVIKRDDCLRRILVVGCGDGEEAADLADFFDGEVDAIDLADQFAMKHSKVTFRRMDARELQFESGAFDLVYSFHALEHIPEPQQAIDEMRRVLRESGIFCIGTPNRLRVVGYMTGRGATMNDKIRWNLVDWRARLSGRFRNEYGAHAGFTSEELSRLCSRIGDCVPATRQYYERLYPQHRTVINLLVTLGLWEFAFPCHYLVGRKGSISSHQYSSSKLAA